MTMNENIVFEHNVETGELTQRQFTEIEIAQRAELRLKIEEEALMVEQAKKLNATQRQVILDRLGISAEEAKLLLS